MIEKIYNPADWYWNVNGKDGVVFSSASGDYVPTDDAAFLAWSADGTRPTNIASEVDLGSVLAPYLVRPKAAGVLDGYQETQATGIAMKVSFKVLFNLLKRVAVLEGKPAPTAAQALAFAKGLM